MLNQAISVLFCSIWTDCTTNSQIIFSYARSFNRCDYL